MLTKIKRGISKTTQFVEDHPTATACAVTFFATWKLSHDVTLANVLQTTKAMSYEWGYRYGELEAAMDREGAIFDTVLEFINVKGLDDEVRSYLKENVSL